MPLGDARRYRHAELEDEVKLIAELCRRILLRHGDKSVEVLESCEAEIEWPDAHEPNCGIVGNQTRSAWMITKLKTK